MNLKRAYGLGGASYNICPGLGDGWADINFEIILLLSWINAKERPGN